MKLTFLVALTSSLVLSACSPLDEEEKNRLSAFLQNMMEDSAVAEANMEDYADEENDKENDEEVHYEENEEIQENKLRAFLQILGEVAMMEEGDKEPENDTDSKPDCDFPLERNNAVLKSVVSEDMRAEYECKAGYFNAQNESIKVLSEFCCEGNLTSRLTCEADTSFCSKLSSPRYGRVRVPSQTVDSEATYSCNSGYSLKGSRKRTCSEEGMWTSSKPRCCKNAWKFCSKKSQCCSNRCILGFCG